MLIIDALLGLLFLLEDVFLKIAEWTQEPIGQLVDLKERLEDRAQL